VTLHRKHAIGLNALFHKLPRADFCPRMVQTVTLWPNYMLVYCIINNAEQHSISLPDKQVLQARPSNHATRFYIQIAIFRGRENSEGNATGSSAAARIHRRSYVITKTSLQTQLQSAIYIYTASVQDFRQVTISSRISRTNSVVTGNRPGFDSRQKELPVQWRGYSGPCRRE
jgi:hypothetical protein